MQWWQFALLGAGGGALVEVLSILKSLTLWQEARRTRSGRVRSSPPHLRSFLDIPAHAWMLGFRMTLGAGAAALFGATDQISGAYAAVVFGFAAPVLLARLGSIPYVANAISGSPAVDSSSAHRGAAVGSLETANEG